jgi:alpha-beta hydrolase superfamily lysophospholipase
VGGVYRVGFEFAPAQGDFNAARDTHWALVDPAARIITGSFMASDNEAVPYRLWPTDRPRALALMLHGAFDYSGAFDEIAPQLLAHGVAGMAIDQRGFGATASRGGWRGKHRMMRDAIEAIAFLKERFGADLPVFIIGESMGAALAVHVASRSPDLALAGLVLAAPGAVSGTWRQLISATLVRALKAVLPQSEVVIERMSAWEFTPAAAIRLLSDPMVLRRIKPAAMFGLFKLSRSAVAEANHVSIPTLTMVGSREDLMRTDCIERLHANLQGEKTWASFAGGPHLLLHWKHSERVMARVLSFIETHTTDSPDVSPPLRAC